MCRTELDAPSHGAFSMIIVPTDNPGYKIVRETPVLGINGGHYEVKYDNVEVPEENLLGPIGPNKFSSGTSTLSYLTS